MIVGARSQPHPTSVRQAPGPRPAAPAPAQARPAFTPSRPVGRFAPPPTPQNFHASPASHTTQRIAAKIAGKAPSSPAPARLGAVLANQAHAENPFKSPIAQAEGYALDALHHLLWGNGLSPQMARAFQSPIGPQGGFLNPPQRFDAGPTLGSQSQLAPAPFPVPKRGQLYYPRGRPGNPGGPNGLRHDKSPPPFYRAPFGPRRLPD